MKKILLGLFSFVGSLCLLGVIFFAGSDSIQAPPSNLIVMADHEFKTYISPECFSSNINYETANFETMTLEKARDLEYEYESSCTYDSLYPSRNNLWDFIGTKLGFLKPLNWKWNEDGTWKEEVFGL